VAIYIFVPIGFWMCAVPANWDFQLSYFTTVKHRAKPTITSVRLVLFGWGGRGFMACHQVCKRNLLEWAMIGGCRLAQSNSLFVAAGPAQEVFFDPQGCGESSRAVASDLQSRLLHTRF